MFNLFKKKKVMTTAAGESYGPDYWNNKYPQAPVIYAGRTLKTSHTPVKIDVKNFVCGNDNVILKLIKRNRLMKSTPNETAIACQKWVVKNIKYIADDQSNKCPEFWQFPFETLAAGIGDCEDGAILLASLLVNAGIPAWRIKVAAGYVQEAPTAPQGGHAYCIYLADRPDSEKKMEWVVLDWCYYEDSDLPCEKKALAKNGGYNNCYKDTWFTFNTERSWNQTKLEIDGRIK